MISKGVHIPDLSLEEGAVLIENWKKTNFSEFNVWMENACAQATLKIEEKFSMDSKSKKSKPVQIKSFQCHLHLNFLDSNLESIIANGFGRNKKDAKKMAIQQMVTFLVQEKLIKYGLKDKSFLENKVNNKAFVKDKIENKLLAPEEEKKNKELKNILEAIQNNLNEDKFEEACNNFSKIKQLKNYEWSEVSGLWTYAVKKRNNNFVKTVLEQISKTHSSTAEEPGISSQNVSKTKAKLCNIYGHSRMRANNPYELYDHRSVANEFVMTGGMNPDQGMPLPPLNGELIFKHPDPESFKALISQFYPADPSSRLSYNSLPEPIQEESIYDLDCASYKVNLEKNGVRQVRSPEFNYINHNLIIEMYDLLMFSGDLKFSSLAAEIIYSYAKLDDTNFVNWCASHYFNNRRNQVFHEMLETNYSKFLDSHDFTKIEGKVAFGGKKSRQDVVMFSPKEGDETLPTKICKKGVFCPGNTTNMFKEGEFILLMTRKNLLGKMQDSMFEEPNQFLDKGSKLRRKETTLETLSRNFELLKRMGFSSPSEMTTVMAFVSEISPNYKLKLYVLFEEQHFKYLDHPDQSWYIIRSNSIFVQNYPKICETLKLFTTRISMNPSLQQILLSIPVSNTSCLNKLVRGSAITLNQTSNDIIKNILSSLEDKMNLPQLEAVKNSLYSNLTLVQTPSGTNKLLPIVEIIRSWTIFSNSQILIYSKNKANIDLIHMALLRNNISSLCLNDEVVNEEFIYEETSRTVSWIYQNNFSINPFNIKYENLRLVMEQFKVICCTPPEILNENLKNFSFSRILVDDANQLTELELLPAVIKNCQQLVLMGDDKQMPPVSLSVMARSKGLNLSVFEKLIRQRVKPITFSIQYQMHPSLYVYPSCRFYQGLITSAGKEYSPLIKGIDWPNKSIHILFVNVPSREEIMGNSIVNQREVEVVCKILAKILAAKDVQPAEICTLTAYHGQKTRLRQEFSLLKSKYGVNVDSSITNMLINGVSLIDDALDCEKELAIFSCARTNNGKNQSELDVLGDPRTLNTVLTRARRGLVIVGDLLTLVQSEEWREYFLYLSANGLIVNV